MAKGEQIDRLSKMYVKLSAGCKAYAKRMHKRYMRRKAKNPDEEAPRHNRYDGWIG
jgi:hypothetical protein